MKAHAKLQRWERIQSAWAEERDVQTFLRTAPLPQNDPAVMRPTKIKVLRASFCIKGKSVELGAIITVPYYDALDLVSREKAEIIAD